MAGVDDVASPTQTDLADLDTRVGRVEGSVVQLSTELKNTNGLLQNVARQLEGLYDRQRPNWTLMIMAAGFALTLGGLAVAPLYREADNHQRQLEQLNRDDRDDKIRTIERLYRKVDQLQGELRE